LNLRRASLYNTLLMLTGYNTDFKFQGKVYHCQTEDGGVGSPYITSLLYFQGAILASRKTSYSDIIKADCLGDVVRELMTEQHKQMIRDLMQGKLPPHNVAAHVAPAAAPAPKAAPVASAPPAAPQPVSKPAPPPAPKEEPQEKSLDDIILDFLASEDQSRKK